MLLFKKNILLQAFCKENLEMNVSPQNVLEILDAANSIQVVDMKNYALDLIVQNFAQVIIKSRIIISLLVLFLQ